MDQREQALDCYRRGVDASRAPDASWVEGFCLRGCGLIHEELGQIDDALEHQDERLEARATVQQIIDRALSDLRVVEQRMRRLEAAMADGDESGMAEYGELMTVFELRGGYDADARVEGALHGLGLGLVGRDRTVGSLSGGEQVRLRLAAVLAATPEVLLLDEPTNHLDETR
jgi:ATPase subunit of ABC transporter with duplicated ATPase domains